MYAITRRLDVLAPVLIDCNCSDGRNCREREKGTYYGDDPTVENAVTRFNAHTVTYSLDVVDRRVASIVDTRTVDGSVVRIYNAAGFGFMTLESDIASTRFDSLFGGKLVGTRHAEDDDCTREEPVDFFPFAELVTATRPYSESEADFLL